MILENAVETTDFADEHGLLESAVFFGGLSGGGEAGALDAFGIDFPSQEYREGSVLA